jgi:hypothetical protein
MLTGVDGETLDMTQETRKYFVKCVSYLMVEGDSKKGVEDFVKNLDLSIEYGDRFITSADLVAVEVTEAIPN